MINWKTGLVLLAVLAGLALYAYQTRPHGSPAPAATLVPCGAADTLELRLEQPGVAVLDLQRAAPGADWQILLPAPGAADAAALDSLLGGLQSTLPTATIGQPPSGSSYGFDRPSLRVSCRLSGGRSYTLSIGDKTFDGSSYYVRLSGQSRVEVISAGEVDQLNQALAKPPYRPSPSPAGSTGPSPTT